MTPENLPIEQAPGTPDSITPKNEEMLEHPLTLEEIEDGAKNIEDQHIAQVRQEALNTMTSEATPYGTLTPEGKLFTPTKEVVEKKSTSWMPSLINKVKKAAVFTGIASAGIMPPQDAHGLDKPGQHDNTSPKIEIGVNEKIRVATDNEMTAYNDYLKFLETKHMVGKKELNKIDVEKKLIEEFNKTAKIKLEWSSIKPVQYRIQEIRNHALAKQKDGKIEVVDKDGKSMMVDTALFMANTSVPDGKIGIKSSEHLVSMQTNTVVNLKKQENVVSKEFRNPEERNGHY